MAQESNQTNAPVSQSESTAHEDGNRADASSTAGPTIRVIRLAGVSGTLLVVGLIAIYLVFGAAGLMAPGSGSLGNGLTSLARVLIPFVAGSYIFVFLRPPLGNLFTRLRKAFPPLDDRLLLVCVLTIAGGILGYFLAEFARKVEYLPTKNQIIAEAVYGAIKTDDTGLPKAVQTAIATARDEIRKHILADGNLQAGSRAIVSSAELQAANDLPSGGDAVATQTAAGAAAKAVYDRALIALAAAQLAAKQVPNQQDPQEQYKILAELLAGICLAVLVFAPESMIGLVRPGAASAEESTPAVLSTYLGLALGILLSLVLPPLF